MSSLKHLSISPKARQSHAEDKSRVEVLGPDTRSLHSIDEKAPEAAALQEVQGVDGGAPW